MQNITATNITEKIMVMQKLNCQRLARLQRADPIEYAKYKHFQTNDPFLWKSAEEKVEIEKVMKKYANIDKKIESENKRAAVFESKISVEDLDGSCSSTSTYCSSSEFLESDHKDLFFTVEEIEQLSQADKFIYMNKL